MYGSVCTHGGPHAILKIKSTNGPNCKLMTKCNNKKNNNNNNNSNNNNIILNNSNN